MWASPMCPEAGLLLDPGLLRLFSLILLEKPQGWVLQRCCLKPDPILHDGLKASYLLCVDTDTSKHEFPCCHLELEHKNLF